MNKIPFMKFSGAGNDFIVVDNRKRVVEPKQMAPFVARVCRHHLSVGADGVIFIEKSRKANFRWRFYNNNGGEAEFCGNGARCAARFAYLKRIAPKVMRFEGAAGMVHAVVDGDQVTVRVPEPTATRLNVRVPLPHSSAALPPGQVGAGGASAGPPPGQIVIAGHAINTGVPHFVYFVPDTATAEVIGIGRPIRYHDAFKPAGTNANFVQVVDRHTIHVRTYERGVEDETLACGSGSLASALIAALVYKVESPVTVVPLSRMPLTVTFRMKGDPPEAGFVDVTLTGNALVVYEGLMRPEAWEDGRR